MIPSIPPLPGPALILPKVLPADTPNMLSEKNTSVIVLILLLALIGIFCYAVIRLTSKLREDIAAHRRYLRMSDEERYHDYRKRMIPGQGSHRTGKTRAGHILAGITLLLLAPEHLLANDATGPADGLWARPGVLITIILLLMPILLGIVFILVKAVHAYRRHAENMRSEEENRFAEQLMEEEEGQLTLVAAQINASQNYALQHNELAGTAPASDERGILDKVSHTVNVNFTSPKKKADVRPALDRDISKLIIWYMGCAVAWLIAGGAIGEYVGIKFVSPDIDHVSWLSFGRLRPVHTNMVFWGWASLGIIGLGYYVVPTVSNTKIYSIRLGWIALWLTNAMVILGSISLMAGINNGGGEFREYIWPVMALFAAALILTVWNFIQTVARRTTTEIYISNWYIVGALLFTIIIALTAYLPFWQNGIGETIVQGYYMHSGVGMWFTLFTLGLLYYFIPQQLNRPIYAYSLGVLAFWTQILFYTIIGTHHFVFSAIPWWLQTVAIVGSAGMIIPVIAATINFTMTFKGQWRKVSNSYTLPFFLVAVIYYFIVSMQGTAEAFKFTNLLWHFTDFTVGHSHLGFYGIITFAIWGGMYAILPRLTGKEPPQYSVGIHFWLAFVGLLIYVIPLSLGGTLKGLMWMEKKPFIDSVIMMFDYWLWRAIGGSLMVLSHFVFAYNFYRMACTGEKAGLPAEVSPAVTLSKP